MTEAFSFHIPGSAKLIIGFVCLLYVLIVIPSGSYFSRFNSNLNDFFYSGQRFSWWVPAASMVATGIGSYSYLKYSEQGLGTGMSSTLTYLNDWFILPFFLFGWLPILYFSKTKSVPEYFAKRYNSMARYIALTIILAYMFFYIGYNLYTIGIAIEGIFNISLIYSVPLLAIFLGTYVTFGGQTAVIFTDLFQGIMLYVAGAIAIVAAVYAIGGLNEWWAYLPETHRLPFVHLTNDPKFNTSGLFWGEALAGSIAFTFMNQGFLMRYLSIKSVREGRKAGLFNVLVTLPLSAIVVGAVGWVGKAILVKQSATGGALEGFNFIEIENTFHTFLIVCWETLKHNSWVFGFVIAALMAALMSTIDTLINACAAIGVYDLYKPLIKKNATDAHYLKSARWASVITTLLGALLVVWFSHSMNNSSGSISLMSLHYKGIMIIIPSIVTTIFLGMLWPRFNAPAACVSMVLGSAITVLTVWYPSWIDGISWFVVGPSNGIYIYFRALYGMVVTGVIGVIVALLTAPPKKEKISGLTMNTINEGMVSYKDSKQKPNHACGKKLRNLDVVIDNSIDKKYIELSAENLNVLKANSDDLVYIADNRWYLGGLRSGHIYVRLNDKLTNKQVALSKDAAQKAYLLKNYSVSVEKII